MSRIVKATYHGVKEFPLDLPPNGLQVFLLFCKCFEVANNIREAPLADVIWGFTKGGYPQGMVMEGLRDLTDCGYIVLTDEWCKILDLSTVGDATKVWYMLTDKWLNVLAGPEAPGKYCPVYFEDVKVT